MAMKMHPILQKSSSLIQAACIFAFPVLHQNRVEELCMLPLIEASDTKDTVVTCEPDLRDPFAASPYKLHLHLPVPKAFREFW